VNFDAILKEIEKAPPAEQQGLIDLLQEYASLSEQEEGQTKFMTFVKKVWPHFIEGWHHNKMAEAFEEVLEGKVKRLIISMPPRHTKSEFGSYLLPAWFMGRFPNKKVIQCSNTAELAVGFGRRVRDLVDDPIYGEVFPDVALKKDSKAANRWATSKGGEYFAIGVNGKVTGKGADLLIIDDPHSEQEAKQAESKPETFDDVYDWYTSGPRQRLQPGAAIIIIQTRWSRRDLAGKVLKASAERGGDEWKYIELPAILPSGKPLWPEFWPLKELEALREELPSTKWQAQYQQTPYSDEGAIIKREWWRTWEERDPPQCSYIIQSWDTAYEAKTRSDFSACTTWGVFYHEDPDTGRTLPNLMLLDSYQKRMEFPELKRTALELWRRHEPDTFLIEAKAAGAPLIYELRAMGIPVSPFVPTRAKNTFGGGDKIMRVNAIADIFQSGLVWAPPTRWAEEVIEQCAEFPAGERDDLVDTVSMSLIRFRQGGLIGTRLDSEEEDDQLVNPKQRRGYFLR
jgi:predicted phage terminase large subunit-like protein